MNAKPTPAKTKPPLVLADLEAELAELEQALAAAQRGNGAARQDLAAAIASADAEAIQQARQQIRDTAADIAELGTEMPAIRAAVEEAKTRLREQSQMQRGQVLGRLAKEMVESSGALEEEIVRFAAARKAAVDAATEYEMELARCSVTFDAYLSIATRLDARVELAMWLETDGKFGRARSLDTPTQLRESRRASLSLAANDFRTLTLSRARTQLGLSPEGV